LGPIQDPKEYLPFLREIKQLPDVHMQHFKIDDHLQRRSKALQSLILAGPSHADQVIDYVSMHRLYEDALRFYRHDLPRLQVMHTHFASYLYERAKYSEAALRGSLRLHPARNDAPHRLPAGRQPR
jgi:elongator complex protein 1